MVSIKIKIEDYAESSQYLYSEIQDNKYVGKNSNKKNINLVDYYLKKFVNESQPEKKSNYSDDFRIFYCTGFDEGTIKEDLRDKMRIRIQEIEGVTILKNKVIEMCPLRKDLKCLKGNNGITNSLFSRKKRKDDNTFNQYYVIQKCLANQKDFLSKGARVPWNKPLFPESGIINNVIQKGINKIPPIPFDPKEKKNNNIKSKNDLLKMGYFIPTVILVLKGIIGTLYKNKSVSDEINRLELLDSSFFEIPFDGDYRYFMKCEFSSSKYLSRTKVRIPYIVRVSQKILDHMKSQLDNMESPIGKYLLEIYQISQKFDDKQKEEFRKLKEVYKS